MSERQQQPWAILIVLLIALVIGWLTVLSGALEPTSAPQNMILVLSKVYATASTLGLVFLVVSNLLRRPKA
jgi:hypothetical protein